MKKSINTIPYNGLSKEMSIEEKIKFLSLRNFCVCSMTSNGWVSFERSVFSGYVSHCQKISLRMSIKKHIPLLIKYNF